MIQIKLGKLVIGLYMTALIGVVTGCMNDKDYYDPNFNKNALPAEKKEFGFTTRTDVKLSVNYGLPGFQALIKIYDENPLNESDQMKEGVEPIYSAYTDDNGIYEGNIYIPTSVEEVYLCTSLIGLPYCVKLEATANGFVYDASQSTQSRAALTRVANCPYIDMTSYPYKCKFYMGGNNDRGDNVYSIVTWNENGTPEGDQFTKIDKVGSETIGTISERVSNFLISNNVNQNVVGNKNLLRNPEQINITIPSGGSEVSVTFVGAKGQYSNSFGYYYYPKGTTITKDNFYKLKKYIIYPCANSKGVIPGNTIKLQYFDESGKASNTFPEGYNVGWFLIADGFNVMSYAGFIGRIQESWFNSYGNSNIQRIARNVCFSNETDNLRQFITVYDEKSKIRIVGIEDSMKGAADDYMDLTFFVTTSADLGSGELPEIEDPNKPVTAEVKGTLAFEDVWPTGGDYDLNDVAVKYTRTATFNKDNKVTSMTETFTFCQKENAAEYEDYFAYQVKNLGTVVASEECIVENETNSIIINGTSKNNIGKTFTVTRTLEGNMDLNEALKDFNPYIIIGKVLDNRKEVHLPNFDTTIKMNRSLSFTGADAWYMDRAGRYPFAIDIPMINFNLSPETTPIDKVYPRFRTWADSNGTDAKDWYKDDISNKNR